MHALKRRSFRWLNAVIAVFLTFAGVGLTGVESSEASAAISRPAAEVGVSTTDWTSVCTGSCDISGFSGTIKIVVWVAIGYVKLGSTSGFGPALTGYPSARWTDGTVNEIAFTASQADANIALEGLQYKANGSGTHDLRISVTTFQSGTAADASTGHFYEVVNNVSNITWELARCKAKYGPDATFGGSTDKQQPNPTASIVGADRCTNTNGGTRRTMNGLNGYLANITSQAEQIFLKDKLTEPGWIGGSDNTTEGIWQWNDGATQIHRLGEPRISSMAARCITTSATGNQMDQAEMNNSLSLLLEWTTVMERLGTTVKTTAVVGDTTSLNTVMMEELLPPLQQASKFSFL